MIKDPWLAKMFKELSPDLLVQILKNFPAKGSKLNRNPSTVRSRYNGPRISECITFRTVFSCKRIISYTNTSKVDSYTCNYNAVPHPQVMVHWQWLSPLLYFVIFNCNKRGWNFVTNVVCLFFMTTVVDFYNNYGDLKF